jgi:ribonuclease Y
MLVAIAIGVGVVISAVFAFVYRQSLGARLSEIERQRESVRKDAEREGESIIKEAKIEAKDIIVQAKAEVENDLKEQRREVQQLEKRFRNKEEQLDRKIEQAERREVESGRREQELGQREQGVAEKERESVRLVQEQTVVLERLSGTSSTTAREELFVRVENDARLEITRLTKQIEDDARENAEKKAREIISNAIQRYASDYVADATVSNVALPNDELKGRIIGREGRNIRALEAATGVDLIVDDTPEVVTLSAFDPVRREIARLALERLIADGRIHPARIEELVEKARKEVNTIIAEEGEKAVFDLGLSGIHPELIKTLGRLKYRTSYGQNMLQHSREVAYLAGMMAAELGVDVKLAKRGGLLHDIGKAVDHEVEGTHYDIGANLARKLGENGKVVNAIFAHHGDGEVETVEAALVAAADALSAARPGVRRESIENYLKRLEKLEEIAKARGGVEKCYAIQAGREVRIIVKPEEMTDEMSWALAKDISKSIEQEMTYPGQIKVTVIRESRYVEYAK